MATNINIITPNFNDAGDSLLSIDNAIRAATRASLLSKEDTFKIEKRAESQTIKARNPVRSSGKPLQDPGAIRKKKPVVLTAGGGASSDEEDEADGGGSGPTYAFPTLAVVKYEWFDGRDLDTGTSIVSPITQGPVGYDKGDSTTYLQWNGDNTSQAGSETVSVFLSSFVAAFPSTQSLTIGLGGNWYGQRSSGNVQVSVKVTRSPAPEINSSVIKNVSRTLADSGYENMGSVTINLITGTIIFN